MNTRTIRLFLAATCAFALALFLLPSPAHAQAASDAVQVAADSGPLIQPDTAAAIATPFIVAFAVNHPWVLTVLAAIGAFRFFFKPGVSLLEGYVRSTPQKTDDALYDKATHSAWFKWLAWFLDFAFSVKVGPQFTAKPEGTK